MQNPPVSSSLENNPPSDLTFEQAFGELESIVNVLETDEHSLENALSLFERGQILARYCASLLDQAELKIQQISGGELVEFHPSST